MTTLWAYWVTTMLFKRCYHWPALWKRIVIEKGYDINGEYPHHLMSYIYYEVHYTNKFCGAWCCYPVELDPGLKQVIKIMWNKYFNQNGKGETESINGTEG